MIRKIDSNIFSLTILKVTTFSRIRQSTLGNCYRLARADAEIGNILPEGIDKTKEGYKREILRLRIENERLKKKYLVRQNEDGQTEYVRLKMKSSK